MANFVYFFFSVRKRLQKRSDRRDANAAFPITEELQEKYWSGFQAPTNEDGTWVVENNPI